MLPAHWLVLGWALCIVWIDAKARRIPNGLNLGAAVAGLAFAIFTGQAMLEAGYMDILLGLLLAALLTIPAYLQRLLGAGDAKLLLAIAMLGGWKAVLVSFAVAGLLGGFTVFAMLQYSTYSGRGMPNGRWLPFGALLAMGLITSLGIRW